MKEPVENMDVARTHVDTKIDRDYEIKSVNSDLL